ncbi:hypothetical protein AAFF_G00006260 [Aldrovandia affinis]|uniref:Uncharacterized protein n=1 Tax=Aldrovandia affinis TaxID=143900 RepID=A0AAD7X3P0_9TELE|nr:hypothetical protein AAFF_G00006260 [Aldrovandia affinis]
MSKRLKRKLFTTAVKKCEKSGSEDESDFSGLESCDSLEEDTLDSGDNSRVDMDTCPFGQLNSHLPSSSNQPAAVAHRRLNAPLPQSSGSQAASDEGLRAPSCIA